MPGMLGRTQAGASWKPAARAGVGGLCQMVFGGDLLVGNNRRAYECIKSFLDST